MSDTRLSLSTSEDARRLASQNALNTIVGLLETAARRRWLCSTRIGLVGVARERPLGP
jgi:hypothetical protein